MKVLFLQEQIETTLDGLAVLISQHYKSKFLDGPPLILTVLNGGVFFYVDLVRRLSIQTEMGVVSTSHYPKDEQEKDEIELNYFDALVKDRNVLIVDEICYTGKTLHFIKEKVLRLGAKDVKTAVLLWQQKPDEAIIHTPDFHGLFHQGSEWCYGYGMDLNGLFRENQNILCSGLPLQKCKHGYVYEIDARNFSLGVFDSESKGFIGIRQKFGDEFLATEYHYDTGPPFGTATPIVELGECPLKEFSRNNTELLNFLKTHPKY